MSPALGYKMTKPEFYDEVHELWDQLGDFDAAHAQESLKCLLEALCKLVRAQNAYWFGAVRVANANAKDPLSGWRPRCLYYLHPCEQMGDAAKEKIGDMDRGKANVPSIRNAELAGTFRAKRLADLMPKEWFETDAYLRDFKGIGQGDVIFVGIPVNEDAECYFGIIRDSDHPSFTERERDFAAYILRGLKWFCRQQMLSRGLTVASTPLTATERIVLDELLTSSTEKQIAEKLGRSYHTTHEYVTAIYRKFGVNNRPALMSLWLGRK